MAIEILGGIEEALAGLQRARENGQAAVKQAFSGITAEDNIGLQVHLEQKHPGATIEDDILHAQEGLTRAYELAKKVV